MALFRCGAGADQALTKLKCLGWFYGTSSSPAEVTAADGDGIYLTLFGGTGNPSADFTVGNEYDSLSMSPFAQLTNGGKSIYHIGALVNGVFTELLSESTNYQPLTYSNGEFTYKQGASGQNYGIVLFKVV